MKNFLSPIGSFIRGLRAVFTLGEATHRCKCMGHIEEEVIKRIT